MLSINQLKSIELLNEFIAKTPAEEIKSLVSKHANSEIEGPTFYEYLHLLSNCDFLNYKNYSPFADPPNKIKIKSINNNPTFCGVSFLITFAIYGKSPKCSI